MNNLKGIDRANLDESVSPAQDFYQYADGGWMAANPLKPEFARFGMFDKLRENAREQLRDLVNGLESNPDSKTPGTNAQKVSDLYSLGMDEERLNREGAAPLRPLLDKIEAMGTTDMEALLAFIHSGISSSIFSTGVGSDPKDSDVNVMYIGETGLGLGDRDYYLEDNDDNRRIMEAYKIFIKKMITLAGYDEARAERVCSNVISLEIEIARNKMTREDRRDPNKRYNMLSINEICEKFPHFDWKRYFDLLDVKGVERANISSIKYIEYADSLLADFNPDQIIDYVIFDVISESANLLSDDFINANFELYGRVMSGSEEIQPRWKRAMAIPGSMLGEALGQLYVEKYFPKENKDYMIGLVENLRTALGEHIDNLTWMGSETKEAAHKKLAALTVKIGYPDKWKDYSEIQIDPEKSYLDNVLAASRWYTKDNYARLHKPVDKTEWHMTPQTVNAYYSPSVNEICFPAAILQPPYFDPKADDALNYGAIGVVIGHEITHAFDDQGRHFDSHGNLNEWWTEQDAEAFKALADKLVAQFDAIEVAPGVHANGRYTLGENIADQGGLRIALTAYIHSQKIKDPQSPWQQTAGVIDGFSPLQRFYLSYALLWAANIREEEILLCTKTDPHSLGRWRTNATLRNLAEFMEAFSVTPSDAMYRSPEERVIIW